MNERRCWILSLFLAILALANSFVPYNLVHSGLMPKDGIFYNLIWWGPVDYAFRGWIVTLSLGVISFITSLFIRDKFKKVIVMTLAVLAVFSGISWLGSLK
jgi:hypothetical protein